MPVTNPAAAGGVAMRRTLALTSPPMHGLDVAAAQRLLANHGFIADSDIDAEFGPATGQASRRAKRALGYPDAACLPTFGEALRKYLAGEAKPTRVMQLRAAQRRNDRAKAQAARTVAEKAADLAVADFTARRVETPAGSNNTPWLDARIKAKGAKGWMVDGDFAWCGKEFFGCSLHYGSQAAVDGFIRGVFNPVFCPSIMAAADAGRGHVRTVPRGLVRKGTGVLFQLDSDRDSDHIGRALAPVGVPVTAGGTVWRPGPLEVVTVEGNTSYEGGSGSQSNGGCVAIRIRPVSSVMRWFEEE